ncbi:DUF7352 domain-containing protein [Rubrivivax sp. RP6-9]|uniref:DUF7352 domain-containing protein n=1 Tax=Rubrivivax sp. RP6-9 TaxID=3415750 RepID=UPI003CC5BDE6
MIWKFRLRHGTGEQSVEMPAGSRLLTVQEQDGLPTLWAICDEGAASVRRKLWAYGTGDAMVRTWPYIATFQSGRSVVHYFDLGET